MSAGIPHQYKWDMGNSTMLSEQLKSDYQESGPGMELVGVSAEMDPPTVSLRSSFLSLLCVEKRKGLTNRGYVLCRSTR